MYTKNSSISPDAGTSLTERMNWPHIRMTQRHQLPESVVQPRTTEQTAALMRLCHEHRLPIVLHGSGTNLSASTVPVRGGIMHNLSRMNRIREIDEQNLTCSGEPGVITADIHRSVGRKDLFYPPDPGGMHVSTIGGNIAQGAGGLRGLEYGITWDYVMGLELVLSDESVIGTGGKSVKDVAGYDVSQSIGDPVAPLRS